MLPIIFLMFYYSSVLLYSNYLIKINKIENSKCRNPLSFLLILQYRIDSITIFLFSYNIILLFYIDEFIVASNSFNFFTISLFAKYGSGNPKSALGCGHPKLPKTAFLITPSEICLVELSTMVLLLQDYKSKYSKFSTVNVAKQGIVIGSFYSWKKWSFIMTRILICWFEIKHFFLITCS